MTKPIALIFVGLVATHAIPSLAQTYKCTAGGRTVYSDQPCGSDAKRINEGAASIASQISAGGPKEAGAGNCKSGAPKSVAWKDPESIRVGYVSGGEMDTLDYADTKIGARRYFISINAKNGNGGYVGAKQLVCFTSQDGMRILKFDDSMLDASTTN